MLTVPQRFSDALVLLERTRSGAAILQSASLATAIGVEVAGLGAYGSAINSTTIHLTDAAVPPANQACVLAHELTHCLDCAFWDRPREQLTHAMIGATEINAHFNEGLIARELFRLATTAGFSPTWHNRSGQ